MLRLTNKRREEASVKRALTLENEIELIEGCRAGKDSARKELYTLYSKQMLAVCYRYTGDVDAAHDVLHDGFIKIFTHFTFRGECALSTWVTRVMVTQAIDYLRKQQRFSQLVVNEESSLSVLLAEDTQKLDEVVVTAMGIKKDAKKLGYAVSTIDAGELIKTGTPDFATSLYGKASGVRIQAAPGGGTSSVSISVRGLSSITGTTQPLIVMDGVPIHNGDANKDGYWTNQRVESNGMVDINPEDIESISILKGAAASALYGSEAANGVVMITSKSGKGQSGLGVDFSANVSFDKVAYMPSIQKEFGPGYDNALLATASEFEQQTGFQNTRTDRNGNQVISPRNTYYSWGRPPNYTIITGLFVLTHLSTTTSGMMFSRQVSTRLITWPLPTERKKATCVSPIPIWIIRRHS